jgi:hypothetical protein
VIAQVVSLVITVQAFKTSSIAVFEIDQNTSITLALTSRVLCDLILTMSMAWYLKKQQSEYSRQATSFLIRAVVIILQDDEHD